MSVKAPADVGQLATMMRDHKIARLVMQRGGDVEIVLHGSAFAAAPLRDLPADLSKRCACLHDIETEHNEAGCLRGCPLEDCVPEEGAEDA